MRRTDEPSPVGEGRVGVAVFLALSGLAYLAYKAEYLGLDAPDALKAFIVLPGVALLTIAAWSAFPDPRRRAGGTLLALGLVALLWLAREPLPRGGWTFYTPMSTIDPPRSSWLKGPEPVLMAFAVGLPFLGLAVILRRSLIGALFFSAAFWTALCLAPSRNVQIEDLPRRYAYYYNSEDSHLRLSDADRSDAVLPVAFGLIGMTLTMRADKRRGGGGITPAPSGTEEDP